MDKLTENAVREIEQIHSSWIEFEVAREKLDACALMTSSCGRLTRGPCLDARAVSAQMARGTTRIRALALHWLPSRLVF